MCRLYSAEPRTSLTGLDASAARRPASAKAAPLGAAPTRDASAAVALMFVSPTEVSAMPAFPMEPLLSSRNTAAATVA